MSHLQENTTLQGGKYRILRVLGQGGFGITYLAEHTLLGKQVAIKEFFMKEFCNRDGNSHVSLGSQGSAEIVNRFRAKFLKEARNLSQFDHPNIIRVSDVFEENGTAYFVMDYLPNGSLRQMLSQRGPLNEAEAQKYIAQIASALQYIHQRKMNHLDVKPANIMLNRSGDSVLIDFGISKQYDAASGQQTSSTPVGISEGFAPIEQYKQGGLLEFSPESDVYALGATYYTLLTGTKPPSATDVLENGLPLEPLKAKGVSPATIAAIESAMQPSRRNRTKDVMELVVTGIASPQTNGTDNSKDETLVADKKATTVSDKKRNTKAKKPAPKTPKRRINWKRVSLITLGVLTVTIGLAYLIVGQPKVARDHDHLERLVKARTLLYGRHCDLNNIDVSNVTDMSGMFRWSSFNGDISKWDVSKVTDMFGMFINSQFNGDISKWDVSNVTNMGEMFSFSKFNGDISQWDVSKVTDMSGMFHASKFNGDISQWDVSNVTYMNSMFSDSQFNGDISQWNVSKVTDMSYMFDESQFNGDISQWDVSNVTDMGYMFYQSHFNGDISNWNTRSLKDVDGMFDDSPLANHPPRWYKRVQQSKK